MVKERDIHFVLYGPSTRSTTGRIRYAIYVYKNNYPAIIAQVAPFINNSPLFDRNPYYPIYAADQLKDVLLSPIGEICIGTRRIYWAKYLPWRSLRDSFQDFSFYTDVVNRLRKSPWNTVLSNIDKNCINNDPLSDYLMMVHNVCSLYDKLNSERESITATFCKYWCKVKLGFSHGDLWVQDIFRSDTGQLCIIDWEWHSLARPMGTDFFHLAISALEFGYKISTGEAITCLIWGEGQVEKFLRQQLCALWDELGYDTDAKYLSMLSYLIYIQYRVSRQYLGFLPPRYINAARALHIIITSDSYLSSLIKMIENS